MTDKKRWIFAAKIHDRAGAVTAVASVFSNRGISVEMTLGSTLSVPVPDSIGLYYVFTASEARKDALLRTVSRLSVVISIQSYSYDAPELRAVAIVRLDPRSASGDTRSVVTPSAGSILCHPVDDRAHPRSWFFMGVPSEVMDHLDRLRNASVLADATVTILPVE